MEIQEAVRNFLANM